MIKPATIYLHDYAPPSYLVTQVWLQFTLNPETTEVVSRVHYQRNPDVGMGAPLLLDGHDDMALLSLRLDGVLLSPSSYCLQGGSLRIDAVPEAFELEVVTRINPQANSALEGLYRSSGNYCTQCEAEGFRRITFYQDRPDVMAPFTVRIVAEQEACPVLLSNGNPVASGVLDDGWHWAEWHDPFAKPCYLFALVAGKLASVEDHFTTMSGREVTLRIYTEPHYIDQCDFAMASLKRAMRWDEQRFGLEYDLDLFMIVAVDDFNMGAMENKGLNIFNARLVFASPDRATDEDYIAIEAVIGHEYFHNWTGNRITCRDWFQLSLKEGLTVFRDQEFTADLHSRAVKRIEDVGMLRQQQFAEDASPMAHPIRPSSYMEINNFYTVTVYEKGAEVVRLYHTLLGEEGFQKGMRRYIARHDGQAVTTEDFLAAMADANDVDLSQMQRWYDQAGTPKLQIRMDYDAESDECTLHCVQSCPPTAECAEKLPFLIPLRLALLASDGRRIALQLRGEAQPTGDERLLLLTRSEQSFTFIAVDEKPLPSLLRGFSAPVELDYPYSYSDDAFLMQYDDDAFNRWAASQRLAMQCMLSMLEKGGEADDVVLPAFAALLKDHTVEPALRAKALQLPSETELAEAVEAADPGRIHAVREQLRRYLAENLQPAWKQCYEMMADAEGLDDRAMQKRSLKHCCLDYLAVTEKSSWLYQQFMQADNMSDQYAVLRLLASVEGEAREQALAAFADQWQQHTHVMDKWFAVQAGSSLPDTLKRVKQLMKHPAFHAYNPNKVRALIGTFAMHNPVQFHAVDGSGYDFICEQVLVLDRFNAQLAARMVRALISWERIEPVRAALMRAALQRIAATENLSVDVGEIVNKSCNDSA